MDGLISSSGGKTAKIHMDFRSLSLDERKKAALKGLGINWGLSLLFLPLPPVHWVATPFFFFFGPFWARKKFMEHEYFKTSFPCPECSKTVDIAEQPAKKLQEITCPHCRYLLRITW